MRGGAGHTYRVGIGVGHTARICLYSAQRSRGSGGGSDSSIPWTGAP